MLDMVAWGEINKQVSLPSLLVHDTFQAYMTEHVKAVFTKEDSHLALIPGRLTTVLKHLGFLE
mgnify:CR=1 FL=1